MDSFLNVIVRKANIICPDENFYCAGICGCWGYVLVTVLWGNVGSLRQILEYPTARTDDARAGRRDPQTVAEKLSHNSARRWRMDETRARMGSVFFEFLSTRRDTKAKQSRHGRAWLRGFFYVSLVASKLIPVPTET